MSQKIIKIESLSKKHSDIYGYSNQIFEDITFDIEQGKVTTLLAPNGAGKSTLLRMIAGIDEEGTNIAGKRIYIPTEPSSFPWLNVRENIIFNLKDVSDNDFKSVLNLVGLEGYEDHYPNNDSIGFRFRISLSRAIINKPELILIDETISTLSFKRKVKFYSLIRKVAVDKGIPILYATSLLPEAIRLSDKVISLSPLPGRVICEKRILIDEEERKNAQITFNISDYFDKDEIAIF